jgi:hypothetical protein
MEYIVIVTVRASSQNRGEMIHKNARRESFLLSLNLAILGIFGRGACGTPHGWLRPLLESNEGHRSEAVEGRTKPTQYARAIQARLLLNVSDLIGHSVRPVGGNSEAGRLD